MFALSEAPRGLRLQPEGNLVERQKHLQRLMAMRSPPETLEALQELLCLTTRNPYEERRKLWLEELQRLQLLVQQDFLMPLERLKVPVLECRAHFLMLGPLAELPQLLPGHMDLEC